MRLLVNKTNLMHVTIVKIFIKYVNQELPKIFHSGEVLDIRQTEKYEYI